MEILAAGAGFKIVITLFSLAIFKQWRVTSFGTSNCVKKIFEFLIILMCLSISEMVKASYWSRYQGPHSNVCGHGRCQWPATPAAGAVEAGG